jgi:autotransporter translocation and assembly factor TamB
MARRVVRARWLGWTRRLVGVTAIMLLLPTSFAAYLVGTTGGGRLALSLAERFLPEQAEVEVGRFSGRLVDRFELSAVRLRLPNLEATADRVSLEWGAAGLLRKRVHVKALIVDGVDVRLLSACGTRCGSPVDGRRRAAPWRTTASHSRAGWMCPISPRRV